MDLLHVVASSFLQTSVCCSFCCTPRAEPLRVSNPLCSCSLFCAASQCMNKLFHLRIPLLSQSIVSCVKSRENRSTFCPKQHVTELACSIRRFPSRDVRTFLKKWSEPPRGETGTRSEHHVENDRELVYCQNSRLSLSVSCISP